MYTGPIKVSSIWEYMQHSSSLITKSFGHWSEVTSNGKHFFIFVLPYFLITLALVILFKSIGHIFQINFLKKLQYMFGIELIASLFIFHFLFQYENKKASNEVYAILNAYADCQIITCYTKEGNPISIDKNTFLYNNDKDQFTSLDNIQIFSLGACKK